jgi:hypothetical protein
MLYVPKRSLYTFTVVINVKRHAADCPIPEDPLAGESLAFTGAGDSFTSIFLSRGKEPTAVDVDEKSFF